MLTSNSSRLYVVSAAVRWTPEHRDTWPGPHRRSRNSERGSALSASRFSTSRFQCYLCDTETPLRRRGAAGTTHAEAVNRLPHRPGDAVAELHLQLLRALRQIHDDYLRKVISIRIRITYTSIATQRLSPPPATVNDLACDVLPPRHSPPPPLPHLSRLLLLMLCMPGVMLLLVLLLLMRIECFCCRR